MRMLCKRPGRAWFEPLEPRLLLDGHVAVWVSKGDLIIRGDFAANEITVTPGVNPGDFEIEGDNETIVNNEPRVTMTGVTDDFNIRMGDGRDVVFLDGVTVPDALTVRTWTGTDAVVISESHVLGATTIKTHNANDDVAIANSRFDGKVYLQTKA